MSEPDPRFAARLLDVLNAGALGLMTALGHRTGLFDTMAGLPPATSPEIAAAAGLDERYVREWLAAMVTGRFVDFDGTCYHLPAERAHWLVRASGPDNLALQARYLSLLAQVEDGIVGCFRDGGGLPYSAFPAFTGLMAEESAAVHDAGLLDTVLPLVPGLTDRLRSGIDVADVGCGSGHALNLMARAFPASRFTGYDLSEGGLLAAATEAAGWGLANVRFELRDAADLGLVAALDLVTTFDAVHDQARPDVMLAGIARALRPGGVYLCADIAAETPLAGNLDHPLGPFLYAISCMHCMTVSLADGGLGLGTMWGRQKAEEMLTGAGFEFVETRHIDGDVLNNYYLARV